jgi:hypothetical protein
MVIGGAQSVVGMRTEFRRGDGNGSPWGILFCRSDGAKEDAEVVVQGCEYRDDGWSMRLQLSHDNPTGGIELASRIHTGSDMVLAPSYVHSDMHFPRRKIVFSYGWRV